MSSSMLNMEMEIMKGVSSMVFSLVSKAVLYCGEVHNFDGSEMLRSMNMNDMLSLSLKNAKSKSKVLKDKVLKSKVPMPFLGKIKEGCCLALRQNHGLYSQCDTEVKDEKFCNKCGPSPQYGTIEERLAVGFMEFRDSKGKSPVSYMKVLNKLKISRAEAEEEAGKLNIIINPIHFEEEKVEKKEKGRPKKAKKIIELADDSTDLFAELVKNANEESEVESDDEKSSIAESIIDTVLDKVSETVENNEKKSEKEAEKKEKKEAEKKQKEAEKLAEKEKKEAEKLAEKEKKEAEKKQKEAEKLAEKEKKEAEKKQKEAEKLAEKEKKEAEKKQKEAEKEVEKKQKPAEKKKKDEEKPAEKKKKDEEEEDVVKRFEFEGVKYLKSKKTGIIYNMEQDVIGKWNEKTNKIDFKVADSEEEEDEYDE
jgi:hypothetical protein